MTVNRAWQAEGFGRVGIRLDQGRLAALAAEARGDARIVDVQLGSMSCRAIVDDLGDGLTLIRVEIESEVNERLRFGAVMEEVLRQFPVAYFRIDENGIITDSMGSGLSAAGLVDDEVVGLNVFEAFPGVAEDIRRGLAGESHSYIAKGEAHGRSWAFRTFLSPDVRRGGGVLGISLDVTEQVHAKEALLESEQRLREVADQVPGVVYCYDSFPDGSRRTVFMGTGLEALLGEEIASQVTESPTPLFSRISAEGLAQIRQVGPGAIDRGEPIDLEYEMLRDDGQTVWVRNVVRSVRHPRRLGAKHRRADGSHRQAARLAREPRAARPNAADRQHRRLAPGPGDRRDRLDGPGLRDPGACHVIRSRRSS